MIVFELKDAKFDNGESILNWPYIQHNDYYVFYKTYSETEKVGFNFMSIQIISQRCDEPAFFPENYIEILYWGYAYFDGIRHMYLGHENTENFGYVHYAFLKDHIKILEIIRELKVKYCRDIN